MQFKVTQKNTRQSSRKVRLIANTIKDLPLDQAIKQLAVIERKATLVLLKTIKQAIANAKNNHGVNADNLKIAQILVNEGPRYKRFRAVSRGRAHNIVKNTCHISVTLEEKKPATEKTKAEVIKKVGAKTAQVKKSEPVSKKKTADIQAQTALKADIKAHMKIAAKIKPEKNQNVFQRTAIKKSTSK